MRILICCNAYPPHFMGGAEWIAHYQGKALLAQGQQVKIFAGRPDAVGPRHEIHADLYEGLQVHRIGLTHDDFPPNSMNFSHPRVEEHFIRVLRDFNPGVVHFHNLIGLSVSIIRIAKECGAKTILTLHDYWGFCFRNTLIRLDGSTCHDFSKCEECIAPVENGKSQGLPITFRKDYFTLLMNEVDHFISPSQYLADIYLSAGFPKEKMSVVWNGIDFRRFSDISHIPGSQVRFTYLGSFGKHKGVRTLLAAISHMKHRDCFRLNLVGGGGELSECLRLVRQQNTGDQIRYWGKLDNSQIEPVLAETDVLVLPSVWQENQPVSITEAMAAGIPVVASNIGGIPELVEHNVSGFLFEPGNARELAKYLDELIESPERREEFGHAARQRMTDNTFQRSAMSLQEIYADQTVAARSAPLDRPLIACIGKPLSPAACDAVAQLPDYLPDGKPLFLLVDWLTESQLQSAQLIWVVGDADAWSALALAEKYGVPLVVPNSAELLAAQCRLRNGGLYYRDSHEAAACIAYLLTHESDRLALGRQISEHRHFQRRAVPGESTTNS